LLVAKLDRLSRNVSFLFTLHDGGVKFQALDIPDANTHTLTVMIGMAQREAELNSSRTKRRSGSPEGAGACSGTPRDMSAYSASANASRQAVRTPKADQFARDILPMIEEARYRLRDPAMPCELPERQRRTHSTRQGLDSKCRPSCFGVRWCMGDALGG
jgi:hypothetical protein